MGKTIRRKNVHGYYEYKNEERNHPDAAENYLHSDMPSRRGRWARTFEVKEEGNICRRAEARNVAYKAKYDPEMVDTQHVDQKSKHSDKWNWD